jgi:hypothetical protein
MTSHRVANKQATRLCYGRAILSQARAQALVLIRRLSGSENGRNPSKLVLFVLGVVKLPVKAHDRLLCQSAVRAGCVLRP